MPARPRKGKRGTVRAGAVEPAGFKTLSKAEQIRYLQELWDRIAAREVSLPPTLAQTQRRCIKGLTVTLTKQLRRVILSRRHAS